MKTSLAAARLLLVFTILTGIIYPLVMTGIAQVLFPYQANGSLMTHEGVVVGSELIGQTVDDPRYFSGRPSEVNTMLADSPTLASSGASNMSITNPSLLARYTERSLKFRSDNQLTNDVTIPPEMIMASGSGLDPHISPYAAQLQAERIAGVRGMSLDDVLALITRHTESPQFGILGEARVNVLRLNLALDALND